MEGATILGDNIMMTKIFFSEVLKRSAESAAEKASEKAISIYKELRSKETTFGTEKAAALLDCTPRTVVKHITKGHKKAGKLKAEFKGKSYLISEYDLNEFIKKL